MLRKPTGILLVGFLFIFLFSGLVLAGQNSNSSVRFSALKEISYDFHHLQDGSHLGQLKTDKETIYFPWALHNAEDMGMPDSGPIPSLSSKRDSMLMNRSNLSAAVQNLSATHSMKQRGLLYNNSQNGYSNNGDPKDQSLDGDWKGHFGNYMGIDVSGISVQAINTMEGGSATATSNIIIEPVQIIDIAPEVGEKLR